MEPYVDTHNARKDLTYAALCANQWERAGGSQHVRKGVERIGFHLGLQQNPG